ncbi:MAG: tetratricopeptide repeat protein [Flavobacteriales bacterium]|nr:tetratricopeptide repeat protein [Flavobacteriales bacterium]
MKRLLSLYIFVAVPFWVLSQTQGNFTSQGRFELSKGRYASAIDLFNKAIQISRFNSEAYFLRGVAKYELEDNIGAERDFGKALELNPKNHEAYLYRGVVRSQLLRYRDAFEDFNQALRINNDDWRIYSNRALANLRLDRYVDAIADCNRIIDLKKDNSETYLLRGEAKAGLEMYKVAVADFEMAMKKDSTSMQPVLRRGIARTKLEEYDGAIEDLNRAMELDTASALPIFYRGVVYAEMNKQQLALDDFNRVLKLHPENAVVLFNRAMVYSDMGKTKEAMADYDMVTRLNPNNILGYYNRAILNFNSKHYTDALADLNKAIELFPEFLEAHENRLEALRHVGTKQQYDKAVEELEKVRATLMMSDEDAKYDQQVKLMKATDLKGDFEPVRKEVGKVQYKRVDVKLLPFYRISPFPETDKDITAYDGFNRPYYNTGVIALISSDDAVRKDALEKLSTQRRSEHGNTMNPIRISVAEAFLGRFKDAYALVNRCVEDNDKHAACLFARAVIRQMELEAHLAAYDSIYGELNVQDTVFQAKTEQLISLAEKDYRQVLELDKEMRFAYFNLGYLLATAERYEEAEIQFGLAASSGGNFIEANYNRGLIRILLGKLDKGCEDMSLAGELGLLDSYSIIKRFCE